MAKKTKGYGEITGKKKVKKRTSIGNSKRSKVKNKHKRRHKGK
jgi:hypothetical protein